MGFEINTKKPIHKPITVTVDGKAFTVQRVDREVLKKVENLARKAVKGEIDAAYGQLEILFGKHKELDALDIREVNELLSYVTAEIYKSEKADTQEKKEKGPGDKS